MNEIKENNSLDTWMAPRRCFLMQDNDNVFVIDIIITNPVYKQNAHDMQSVLHEIE